MILKSIVLMVLNFKMKNRFLKDLIFKINFLLICPISGRIPLSDVNIGRRLREITPENLQRNISSVVLKYINYTTESIIDLNFGKNYKQISKMLLKITGCIRIGFRSRLSDNAKYNIIPK